VWSGWSPRSRPAITGNPAIQVLPERLPGGIQAGRPGALQQIPHLLDLAAGLGDQLLVAGTQMPRAAHVSPAGPST
jgi:hypothetical protein